MSSIFKLLIALIVFGLLLYIVLGLFVFPKDNPYISITKTVLLAKQDAGNPYCSILNLEKNKNINTKTLLLDEQLSNLNMYVWFSSSNEKYSIFKSQDYFSVTSKDNVKNLEFCSICYPGFLFSQPEYTNIFNSKSLFCEVTFGKRLLPLEYNFDIISDNENQGLKKIVLDNLPQNYSYYYFVFNNDSKQTINSNSLALFKAENLLENTKSFSIAETIDLEMPKAGQKIIVQAILPKFVLGELILPAKFYVKSTLVVPNNDYQLKSCVPTRIEKQYIDMDRQMCLIYYYCDGCVMSDQCSDAWNNSGKVTEAVSPLFAKGYDTLDNPC